MKTGVDARYVKSEGREPVSAAEYRGWIVEVYRVGRRHEYQGLAIHPEGHSSQTRRYSGKGAMARAGLMAGVIVDMSIEADTLLPLESEEP